MPEEKEPMDTVAEAVATEEAIYRKVCFKGNEAIKKPLTIIDKWFFVDM